MAAAFDADGDYAALRREIVAAGLLRRAYGYYFWRSLASFGLLAAGIVAAFRLAPSVADLVIAASLIAFGSVQVGLIGHDAGHLAVLTGRRANAAVGSVCWSLTLGISFWYWQQRHNRHHSATNDALLDPDVRWFAGERSLLGALPGVMLPFAFRLEAWHFALEQLRGRRRAVELSLMLASAVVWVAPGAVLGWRWIATFALSQLVAGLYLALAIAPNHIGMSTWFTGATPGFLERQVLSSRNVRHGRITDFVLGGLNFQIEHHLFPSMPRCHFGTAQALVKPFCASRGLPYTEASALAAYLLVLATLVGADASTVRSAQAPMISDSGPTVK